MCVVDMADYFFCKTSTGPLNVSPKRRNSEAGLVVPIILPCCKLRMSEYFVALPECKDDPEVSGTTGYDSPRSTR